MPSLGLIWGVGKVDVSDGARLVAGLLGCETVTQDRDILASNQVKAMNDSDVSDGGQ